VDRDVEVELLAAQCHGDREIVNRRQPASGKRLLEMLFDFACMPNWLTLRPSARLPSLLKCCWSAALGQL
jgi:hypothetical protein